MPSHGVGLCGVISEVDGSVPTVSRSQDPRFLFRLGLRLTALLRGNRRLQARRNVLPQQEQVRVKRYFFGLHRLLKGAFAGAGRVVLGLRPNVATMAPRSARPRQQIAHCAMVARSAPRRPHAPVIQGRRNSAERGRTRHLYLAHDWQHVGGEGVRGDGQP
jgi:hypothetical protein